MYGRGSGLELSICREIVRQHHGHIEAEVTPENRTVLRVSFPATAARPTWQNEDNPQ